VYNAIDDKIVRWVKKQKIFFVATAPLAGDGFVNCSPKGLDTLRILGPHQIAYVDFPGSGIETMAHIKENKRIVIMLCAFEGPPKIYRFHGEGEAIEPKHPDFNKLLAKFSPVPYIRSIVRVDVTRISDSCGFGVPLYEFTKHRDAAANYVGSKTCAEIETGIAESNWESLDGLPGIDLAQRVKEDA
jgi:hypothetical protein